MRKLNRPPDMSAIASILAERPPVNIPIPSAVFEDLLNKAKAINDDTTTLEYLEPSDTVTADKFVYPFLSIRTSLVTDIQGSEYRVRAMYDVFIKETLSLLLGNKLKFDRNAEDFLSSSTTHPKKRPDFLAHAKNVLILRGEEKRNGVSIFIPENEILDKMKNWNPAILGRLPYLFGFAAAGYIFRLYILYPLRHTMEVIRSSPLVRELDLSNVFDCIELIKWMFNLAPILDSLISMIPQEVPPLDESWKRHSKESSEVTIRDGFVEKVLIPDKRGYYKWEGEDGLKALYDLNLPNVIRLDQYKIQESKITLHLKPLGFRTDPINLKEVHQCLNDVLTALEGMHANGWVHRDVKIANVILCLDDTWMLIDLDLAAKLDSDGQAKWPSWVSKSLRHDENELWKPKHDIKQVALMLEAFKEFRGVVDGWENLVKSLLNSETTQVALMHVTSFFSTLNL